ncbi:hypothetical protein [Pseudomonas phage COT4]|uniref:Uncharacterized protein n=1 Tax=Pseudomonas phage M5.1 TaxID=2873460 RepID=A0AAE9BNZ7_9CAUD|nr:hypothetical protein QGX13_gp083 [Pseudomonas phage M5.1]UAV89740.1 hypothetical protein M51_159 [Pseudomonas phage M5.1]UGL61340.1 hypothetical protein [Pseudomonas phage COT4]
MSDDIKYAKAKEIEALLDQAQKLVWEAESIADEHGLEFTMDLGGYGMGGTYYSEKYHEEQGMRWSEPGWNASSQSC